MAKDATAKLPTAVPAQAKKTDPAPKPRPKRKVVRQAPTNTVLTDPDTIVEGIKAEYGWDDPDVQEPTPLEPTAPDDAGVNTSTPAAPSTPTAAAPAPKPAAPAHSAVSLHLAKQLGITDAEIADSTPKELDRLVQRLHDQREELRREHVIAQAKTAPKPDAQGLRTTAEAPKPDEPVLAWGNDEDGNPIKESDIHPGLVSVFKAQAKELADLKKLVGQMVNREIGREQQTQAQKLDGLFGSNPDQFGDGSAEKVKTADPMKFQRRLALLAVMKALQSGTMEERFAEASEILYGKAAPAVATAPTASGSSEAKRTTPPQDPETGKFVKAPKAGAIHDADEWENGATELPTNRMTPITKGRKSATDNVERMLRENPELLPMDDYSSEFLSANGQV
jgi:hypothetical protein